MNISALHSAIGRNCARIDDLPPFQHNLTVPLHHAAGADGAAVVYHRSQQGISGAGGHDDTAAISLDNTAVGYLRLIGRFIHLDCHQTVGIKAKGNFIPGSKAGGAFGGDDGSGVLDRVTEQRHKAAGDISLVDHRTGSAILEERILPVHEVAVFDVKAGGHQTADVDAGTGGKEDAGWVDQKDPAIGAERTEDL